MLILYKASGAGDFTTTGRSLPAAETRRLISNAARLLETRGHSDAVKWLNSIVFNIIHSDNFFGDDFHVLFAISPLQTYEAVREYIKNANGKSTFRAIAETLSEIGPFIRFVAVELKLEPNAELTPEEKARKLKSFEIHTLVYRYIGVEGGYLGDFSYRTHHEFYIGLGLDINPNDYNGTTCERFMRILEESGLQVQAQILEGILDRFPVGSSELRTEERAREIGSWLVRLRGAAPVPAPRPSITTEVVVRALADAELLIKMQGAISGIDRLHTAFHGFLRAVCDSSGMQTSPDASITELLTVIREAHPAFLATGARADDIRRVMRSMAAIGDALNPLRNRASVAHPNQELLAPAEAMLVINVVRTLLHYIDAKLQLHTVKP